MGSLPVTPPGILGFPYSSVGKESAFSAGFDSWVRKIRWRRKWQPTPGSVPELGRSPGEGTHCSILAWRIPWIRAWQATVHGVARIGHDLETTPPPPPGKPPYRNMNLYIFLGKRKEHGEGEWVPHGVTGALSPVLASATRPPDRWLRLDEPQNPGPHCGHF